MMTILAIIAAIHLIIMIFALIALIVYIVRPNTHMRPTGYERLYLNDNVSGGGRYMGDPKV
jgi:hypothetical protein